jgi:hypothetical protein
MWNPFKRSADTLLTASDKQQLVEAIQLAEKIQAEKFAYLLNQNWVRLMH